jgi:hypothetical protein
MPSHADIGMVRLIVPVSCGQPPAAPCNAAGEKFPLRDGQPALLAPPRRAGGSGEVVSAASAPAGWRLLGWPPLDWRLVPGHLRGWCLLG